MILDEILHGVWMWVDHLMIWYCLRLLVLVRVLNGIDVTDAFLLILAANFNRMKAVEIVGYQFVIV